MTNVVKICGETLQKGSIILALLKTSTENYIVKEEIIWDHMQ